MAHVMHKCDFCDQKATVDAKTVMGPWAYLCPMHFEKLGSKLPGMCVPLDQSIISPATKRCSICGEEKPITEFYKYIDGRGVERYRTECKACNLAAKKRRRFGK